MFRSALLSRPFELPRQKARRTSYFRVGAGEPILFIHGVGMRLEAWQPQIDHFSFSNDVIAVDVLGHGRSDMARLNPDIKDYADAIMDVMDSLNIRATNIVGHSMGTMIALAIADRMPQRCLRLACLNAVYERSEDGRAAVLKRAMQLQSGSSGAGDIEGPLLRWFGSSPDDTATAAASKVRYWLGSVSLDGYAAAYKVFAESDRVFSGRLGGLPMPAYFITGSDDPNSTPGMSAAMAAAAPLGKAIIIDDARHMMNLTHPVQTNAAIVSLLQTRCKQKG